MSYDHAKTQVHTHILYTCLNMPKHMPKHVPKHMPKHMSKHMPKHSCIPVVMHIEPVKVPHGANRAWDRAYV